ncbi:MAG: GNAT family N-acetyltransferase [Candidatus Planktophila sp.]
MTTSSVPSPLIIETERLILRPLHMSDVDDLYEYQSDAKIVRYIPWEERSREQVAHFLEKAINTCKIEQRDDGDFIVLAWELKDLSRDSKCEKTTSLESYRPGKVIGQSNTSLKSTTDQLADIGWVTHPDYHRQGFAYEATRALMKYVFDNFPVHRIIADIDTRNPESAKLAEKLGMRREGEFINSEFFKGDWCSMWLFAILKEEFNSQ